jgi:hypothetical protein
VYTGPIYPKEEINTVANCYTLAGAMAGGINLYTTGVIIRERIVEERSPPISTKASGAIRGLPSGLCFVFETLLGQKGNSGE